MNKSFGAVFPLFEICIIYISLCSFSISLFTATLLFFYTLTTTIMPPALSRNMCCVKPVQVLCMCILACLTTGHIIQKLTDQNSALQQLKTSTQSLTEKMNTKSMQLLFSKLLVTSHSLPQLIFKSPSHI